MKCAVFIVGAPRSGTTLLQSMLASNSMLYSPPETSFFCRILPLLGVEYFDPQKTVTGNDIQSIRDDFLATTGIEIEDFALKPGDTVRDAFEEIMRNFKPHSKSYWVEKTPNHARTMLAIRRFYPDAKFIHIVRDPVDAVGSMISIKPVSVSDFRLSYIPSISSHCRLWNDCVGAAYGFPYQNQVKHVMYENLVANPEDELRNICEFIEVPFEVEMLHSFNSVVDKIINENTNPWQKNNLTPGVNRDSLYKWRTKLPLRTVWLIQVCTEHLALSHGYYSLKAVNGVRLAGKIIAKSFDFFINLAHKTRAEYITRRTISYLLSVVLRKK